MQCGFRTHNTRCWVPRLTIRNELHKNGKYSPMPLKSQRCLHWVSSYEGSSEQLGRKAQNWGLETKHSSKPSIYVFCCPWRGTLPVAGHDSLSSGAVWAESGHEKDEHAAIEDGLLEDGAIGDP